MNRPRTSQPSQRALTDMAGERVAEMLHWRTGGELQFAVVLWPPRGRDGKATAYVSSNDPTLAAKLSALIGEHEG